MPSGSQGVIMRKEVHMRNESERFLDSRYPTFRISIVQPKSKVASVKSFKNGNGRENYKPQIHTTKETEVHKCTQNSERQVCQAQASELKQ